MRCLALPSRAACLLLQQPAGHPVLLPVSLAAGLTTIAHHPAAAALASFGSRLSGARQAGALRVGAFEQAQRLRAEVGDLERQVGSQRTCLLPPSLPARSP